MVKAIAFGAQAILLVVVGIGDLGNRADDLEMLDLGRVGWLLSVGGSVIGRHGDGGRKDLWEEGRGELSRSAIYTHATARGEVGRRGQHWRESGALR